MKKDPLGKITKFDFDDSFGHCIHVHALTCGEVTKTMLDIGQKERVLELFRRLCAELRIQWNECIAAIPLKIL